MFYNLCICKFVLIFYTVVVFVGLFCTHDMFRTSVWEKDPYSVSLPEVSSILSLLKGFYPIRSCFALLKLLHYVVSTNSTSH